MTDRKPPPPLRATQAGAPSTRDEQLERIADLPKNGAGRENRGPRATGSRRHPAHGARVAALVASVAATGGVAGAIAGAEQDEGSTVAAPEAEPVTSTVPIPIDATSTAPIPTDATSTAPTSSSSSSSTSVSDSGATAVAARHADGIWLGTAEYTEWGDVQVEVTIDNGEIVGVTAVQVPDDRKSQRINDGATPQLEAQAIAIQDADLDIVSGATYTSRTYAASLQAALDDAALAAQASAGSS